MCVCVCVCVCVHGENDTGCTEEIHWRAYYRHPRESPQTVLEVHTLEWWEGMLSPVSVSPQALPPPSRLMRRPAERDREREREREREIDRWKERDRQKGGRV